jgi:uncharacterized protein YcnI
MLRRLRVLIPLVTGILVMLSSPALAHVTINPDEATKGGFSAVTFRVPNERPDSGTIQLEVEFPAEYPIANVSVQPKPGWTYSVEKAPVSEPTEAHGEEITESVSRIIWTGGRIGPGEFDEFGVSMGPLPEDTDQLVFPAIQTYESGEVVRWIEETPPGGEEPEHPAPVLKLVEGDEHGGGGDEEAADVDVGGDDEDDDSNTLAVVALVVGAVGLVTAIGGILMGRRRQT